MLSRLDTALKLAIFFIIAAVLFGILGAFLEITIFQWLFVASAVLAVISLLVWIFKKMFMNNNQ